VLLDFIDINSDRLCADNSCILRSNRIYSGIQVSMRDLTSRTRLFEEKIAHNSDILEFFFDTRLPVLVISANSADLVNVHGELKNRNALLMLH
jgi:hypothetical protein